MMLSLVRLSSLKRRPREKNKSEVRMTQKEDKLRNGTKEEGRKINKKEGDEKIDI